MKRKLTIIFLIGAFLSIGLSVSFAVTVEELDREIKNDETTFYREFFETIFYKQFVKPLQFDRLGQEVQHQPALDINIFDEIPDSGFFVNRHGKNPLLKSELVQGPAKGTGPDPSGPWTIIKGKMKGVSVGFTIEDAKGDRYLLKFDVKEYPEMTTAAEIISHKFFHAFGYYIPEYYLIHFNPDILQIDPSATYYNEDGFKKPLTKEALETFIDRIPKFKGGLVRASASKFLKNVQGNMTFEGRRKGDPDDLIPHEDRRSIRALRVFGSWLNHYDLREGNTIDVIEEENGNAFVKHYLIDFGSALGSAASHPKVPVAGYEHIVDWFEVGKTAPTLKVVEKPWEKKWDALKRQVASPAIGYFDNSEFNPGTWKTQLPYEVFTRLSPADAFWAAKIIMSFSADDIEAIVDSGKFSDPDNTRTMAGILTVRRNIIGRYWFSRVTPLDQIKLSDLGNQSYQIQFEDLNVKHQFATEAETAYRFRAEFLSQDGKTSEVSNQEFNSNSFSFIVSSPDIERVMLFVQARYKNTGWSEPPLKIVLAKSPQDASFSIVEIDHGV